MPAPVGAHVYKNSLLTVEGTAYTNQLTKALLKPDSPSQTLRTLVPDGQVTDNDSPIWTFEISALQINIAGGLAKALRDAAVGDELDCVLQPEVGSGKPQASFTIKAKPVDFGGTQGAWGTFEDVFGIVGQPVFGTAA